MDRNPDRPQVSWKDILTKMVEYGEVPVKIVTLQEEFERNAGFIGTVMRRLHVWQYVRYADRKKRGWGGYVVTEAGKKRVQEWSERQELTE